MRFNKHSHLEGRHALLSASKHHWIRYSEARLQEYLQNADAAARGTRLHALAKSLIDEGVYLRNSKKTLNMFVNDAIRYQMIPEQILYYSDNAFGTADAIKFSNMKLRVSDLKMGAIKAHIEQLEVYVALFCLEYGFKPFEIESEMRIYQNNEVRVYIADPDTIAHIMDRIVTFDRKIEALREED